MLYDSLVDQYKTSRSQNAFLPLSTAAVEVTVPTTNINCWAYGEITTSGVTCKVQHEFHAIHQEIMGGGGGGGDGRHFVVAVVIAVAPIVVAAALRCVQWDCGASPPRYGCFLSPVLHHPSYC